MFVDRPGSMQNRQLVTDFGHDVAVTTTARSTSWSLPPDAGDFEPNNSPPTDDPAGGGPPSGIDVMR
jgi:hypothetical protein